jgi:hypothetical protein
MKRTRITVETERTFRISRRRRLVDDWCDGCGEMVKMIRAEEAAALVGTGLREICRRVETDQVHYKETPEGKLFICLDSLLKQM